ncbi:ATP-binding protein [Streptomyces sp. NK08204]|uniref:ATP-binding protein n=1 Tax=Streptomyces sp. NK08204 TaxID=2873260 RepID=UPI001CEDC80B|nr:ATP-binding protein [Streptomyces sp. NK08204]
MNEPLVLELLAFPKAVPEVRRSVREHLGGPCPEVQLCVSELLANVIRHLGEGTAVTVRVARMGGGRTRLEVTDPDAHAWLVRRRPGADEESGRGLLLVDAVALRWGVEHCPGGKTVWCELPGETAAGVSGRSGAYP